MNNSLSIHGSSPNFTYADRKFFWNRRGSISHVSPSLDAQLDEGASERGVDGSDLLARELFAETGFSALPRFFGFCFV